MRIALVFIAVTLLACSGSEPQQAVRQPAQNGSTQQSGRDTDPAASKPAPTPEPARPALRRVLIAHPDTVARQVPPDNADKVRAYLAKHRNIPGEIITAIEKHEVWLGMTDQEVELSVGPATRQEEGGALFYKGEGWLFRFDENRFLTEFLER